MTVHIKKNGKLEYLTGQVVPQVGNLFIDKLFMTYQIPANLHAATISKFEEAVSNGNAFKVGKTAYNYNIKLSNGNEGNIIIQCAPKKATNNFFRIEFTPSKADLNHLKTVLDIILEESGGYSGLMSKGIVTRIDFTVHADYINHTDILASYPKFTVESHFAKNGVLESKYLGASTSDNQILIYDKPAQIENANKKKSKGLKLPVPDHKRLRIEFRMTDTNKTLKEIEKLPNPFEGLILTAYPESKSMKIYNPLWSLFLSACRFEGVTNALLHFNALDQEYYQNRLITEGRTEWWNPAKAWQGLSSSINVITHAKGNNPSLKLIS